MSDALIEALSAPGRLSPGAGRAEVIETHISWVLLSGDIAYKIKKPVALGFLDYSTIARRHAACLDELRLNRRYAGDLYLDVVAIGGTPSDPALGQLPALEYCVKMRRFPEDRRLDHLVDQGPLKESMILAIADRLAELHETAEVAPPASPFGQPDAVVAPMLANFESILAARPDLVAGETGATLTRLESWTRSEFQRRRAVLADRAAHGFIRDCHGDLHLANMVWLDDGPRLFDCIEFSDALRWIDVQSEIAFLTMDFVDHSSGGSAQHLINRWLERTGDFSGLALLSFYQVYRAMVRAKVAAIRFSQASDPAARAACDSEFQDHLALATRFSLPREPMLLITHGLPGSGKTTASGAVSAELGAVRIRSDVERKRLFGLTAEANSRTDSGPDLYSAQATLDTYAHLASLADTLLREGLPVIVDAAFLRRDERDAMREIAAAHAVPFAIIETTAPMEVLRARVAARHAQGTDASEADVAVLERLAGYCEPLSPEERSEVRGQKSFR